MASCSSMRADKRQANKLMHARAKTTTSLRPEIAEIIAAIRSLYADEVKPFGRILRQRVGELARAKDSSLSAPVDVDAAHLRRSVEGSSIIRVEVEAGGDWSASLRGVASRFVDAHSPEDVYPALLWNEAAAYFEGMEEPLPGSRYACARALADRQLSFLSACSLGQICHIVQLAISKRKLLGFRSGRLVPYGRSQLILKEKCAAAQQPCASQDAECLSLPFATWDSVRAGVGEILRQQEGSRPGTVPLSSLKRVFRARFHQELSETALGHMKLAEVLQDPRLRGVCEVRLEASGYTVFKRSEGQKTRICLEGLLPDPAGLLADSAVVSSGEGKLTSTADDAAETREGTERESTASSSSYDSSPAMCDGASQSTLDGRRRMVFCPDEPLDLEEINSSDTISPLLTFTLPKYTPAPPGLAQVDQRLDAHRVLFCPDEPLDLENLDSSSDSVPALLTFTLPRHSPTPASLMRPSPLPTDVRRPGRKYSMTLPSVPATPAMSKWVPPTPSPTGCYMDKFHRSAEQNCPLVFGSAGALPLGRSHLI